MSSQNSRDPSPTMSFRPGIPNIQTPSPSGSRSPSYGGRVCYAPLRPPSRCTFRPIFSVAGVSHKVESPGLPLLVRPISIPQLCAAMCHSPSSPGSLHADNERGRDDNNEDLVEQQLAAAEASLVAAEAQFWGVQAGSPTAPVSPHPGLRVALPLLLPSTSRGVKRGRSPLLPRDFSSDVTVDMERPMSHELC